jgi:hypothetical protein
MSNENEDALQKYIDNMRREAERVTAENAAAAAASQAESDLDLEAGLTAENAYAEALAAEKLADFGDRFAARTAVLQKYGFVPDVTPDEAPSSAGPKQPAQSTDSIANFAEKIAAKCEDSGCFDKPEVPQLPSAKERAEFLESIQGLSVGQLAEQLDEYQIYMLPDQLRRDVLIERLPQRNKDGLLPRDPYAW